MGRKLAQYLVLGVVLILDLTDLFKAKTCYGC